MSMSSPFVTRTFTSTSPAAPARSLSFGRAALQHVLIAISSASIISGALLESLGLLSRIGAGRLEVLRQTER
ncbi:MULTISPECIES: hypothetical protein [unclassified Rathayibacter]|uniref:hypothetical protein n=1 Tax=unclassified Rathayibacter TaxID=2609250 RepID=UPI000F4C5553|nr:MULTISPECIES: hypothetical protein [unclassified Rathayibacter]